MAASDLEITTRKTLAGGAKGGFLGAIGGLFTGAAVGFVGGLANPVGAIVALGAVVAGIVGAPAVPALLVGLAMPTFFAVTGAAAGVAIGAGAGAGLGGVAGALSGAEQSAEKAAQYELIKERVKGTRQNEIATAQATAIDQIGTGLYMQGRAEQAALDQQAFAALEARMAQPQQKSFVDTCCKGGKRDMQQIVADTRTAADGQQVGA